MQIYNYSAETGEYLGETTARQDPRDAARSLIPKHATTIRPMNSGPFETPVFADGAWKLVDDYRGTIWSTKDAAEIRVEDFGPLPADTTALASPSPLAAWDGAKWSKPSVAQEAAAERELRKQAAWLHARHLVDEHAEKNGLMLSDTVFTGNVQTVYNGLRNGLDAIPLNGSYTIAAQALAEAITWPVP
jgi:hypothetical protein